jgi:hypothetical protein
MHGNDRLELDTGRGKAPEQGAHVGADAAGYFLQQLLCDQSDA